MAEKNYVEIVVQLLLKDSVSRGSASRIVLAIFRRHEEALQNAGVQTFHEALENSVTFSLVMDNDAREQAAQEITDLVRDLEIYSEVRVAGFLNNQRVGLVGLGAWLTS